MDDATPAGSLEHGEGVLVGGIVSVLVLLPLLPSWAASVGTALIIGSLLFAWTRRMRTATSVSLYFSLLLILGLLRVPLPQLELGLALLGHGWIARQVPWLHDSLGWLRRGTVQRADAWLAAGFTGIAGVCLLLWYLWFRPNLDDLLELFVPDASLPTLLFGGLLFAVANAAVEEGAYRGVLHAALERALPGRILPLGLQALAFGTMHIEGFPRGAAGVILASIYGLMMGGLRIRTRGMWLPWIAHTATDFTIALILILLVRKG